MAKRSGDDGTVDGFGPRTNGIDPETGDEIERLDLAPPARRAFRFRNGARASGSRALPPSATRRTCTCAGSIARTPIGSSSFPISRLAGACRSCSTNRTRPASPSTSRSSSALLRQLLPAVALYRPSQPRSGDRRARGRAADRDAAGPAGDRRARVRPGPRETEFRPRPVVARAADRHAASRPDCRAPISAAMRTRSASSPCRCCSGACSTADEYPAQIRLAARRPQRTSRRPAVAVVGRVCATG